MYLQDVKNIFKEKEISFKKEFLICYLLSQRIAPFLSAIYIKKGIRPNTITLHMIISGLIGGFLFMIPNLHIKFVGMIFMQIWFILDCSDGEVARKTKIFSKYGKDIDYLAHIINHPIFTLALCLSMIQLNKFNSMYLIILFALNCIIDLYFRSILKLYYIKEIKEEEKVVPIPQKITVKFTIRKVLELFYSYPNFVLFSSILYFISPSIIIYYSILNISVTLFMNMLITYKYIKFIYYK